MRINTQFKNTLTNHTKSDILTKRLVFLPVDWDENDLLLTKWLNKTKKRLSVVHSKNHFEQYLAL